MNAGMIAKDIAGDVFFACREQREIDARLQLVLEALGVQPSFMKRYFSARAIAALAQPLLLAEDFGHGANNANSLIGPHEDVEPNREMRLVRQAAADAQRIAQLAVALCRRETNVVDLGISAPGGAAGCGDLELARQIVELGIRRQQVRDFGRDRRSVDDFIGGDSRQRAAGDVADHVAAGALGRKANGSPAHRPLRAATQW